MPTWMFVKSLEVPENKKSTGTGDGDSATRCQVVGFGVDKCRSFRHGSRPPPLVREIAKAHFRRKLRYPTANKVRQAVGLGTRCLAGWHRGITLLRISASAFSHLHAKHFGR